jgi:hypothetical protein
MAAAQPNIYPHRVYAGAVQDHTEDWAERSALGAEPYGPAVAKIARRAAPVFEFAGSSPRAQRRKEIAAA